MQGVAKPKAGKILGPKVRSLSSRERGIEDAKTELVSVAAHELRTPLLAVRWFLEILQKDETHNLTAEQKDLLFQAYASNQRMIKLVQSLLNVSRIELGRLLVEPVELELGGAINEVVAEFGPQAQARRQNIIVHRPKQPVVLKVDERILKELVTNLISNALKYSPDGSAVEVWLAKLPHGIEIKVKDHGCGIPKKQQVRLFERFFRADNVPQQTEGTGLGLYIVKSLLDSVGGSISFVSDEGKGSAFTITLPLDGMRAKLGEVALS